VVSAGLDLGVNAGPAAVAASGSGQTEPEEPIGSAGQTAPEALCARFGLGVKTESAGVGSAGRDGPAAATGPSGQTEPEALGAAEVRFGSLGTSGTSSAGELDAGAALPGEAGSLLLGMKTGLGELGTCGSRAEPALLTCGEGAGAGAGLVTSGESAGQIAPEGLGGPTLPAALGENALPA
jgi:hypothetical protein